MGRHGMPIIACEPSCILTIKDDYPALLKGERREKAKAVAGPAYTFEEFAGEAFELKPTSRLPGRPQSAFSCRAIAISVRWSAAGRC